MDQASIQPPPIALTALRSPLTARQSQGTPPKIALLALVGWNNYGNDGSFETMLDFLRQSLPKAELKVICVDPAEIERVYHIPAIPISWPGFARGWQRRCDRLALGIPRKIGNIVQSIREVRQFDFIVVPGTGVLCDYRSGPFGLPYWMLRWCVGARLRGVKLLMVSIGAGPIQRPLSRWMLKQAARAADYCSFRDQYSKNFANGMGLETRANPIYPDLVFKLPIPRTRSDPSATRALTVGVGVMSYNGWQGHLTGETVVYDTYLAAMKRFVVWLLRSGYRVRLLVGEITDQQTVEDLRGLVLAEPANLPDGAELVADPAHSLRDVMEQVADTDIVVASRFHNIIAALMQARPTISISYTPKHDELMHEMGLEMFCQPIEQLNADLLVRQFQDLVSARVAIGQRIADTVRTYQQRLAEQDQVLLGLLG